MPDVKNSSDRKVFHDQFNGIVTVSDHDLLILDEDSPHYLQDHPTSKGVNTNSELKRTKSILQILIEDVFDTVIEQPVFYDARKEFYLFTQSLQLERGGESQNSDAFDIRGIDDVNVIVSVIEHSFQSEIIYKDSFHTMTTKLIKQYYRIPIIATSILLTLVIVVYCILLIKLLILEPVKEIIDLIENPKKFNETQKTTYLRQIQYSQTKKEDRTKKVLMQK